jgi:hypothetical protein
MAQGDRAAAEWEAMEIRVQDPHFATRTWLATYPMTSAGQARRLTDLLSQAGL